MEIPGSANFYGQPTLTNPLSQENTILGQQTTDQRNSTVQNTVAATETPPDESLSRLAEAVEPLNDTDSTTFDRRNPGGTIDFTA